SASLIVCRALERQRRTERLPLLNPSPSSRFAGCPATRATWGDVCSLRAGSLFWMKADACMKPDYGYLLAGSFGVPCCYPVLIAPTGMPWEIMGRNKKMHH